MNRFKKIVMSIPNRRFEGFLRACILLPFVFLSAIVTSNAQTESKLIREGNRQYKDKKYDDAEVSYRKSLNLDKNSVPGSYNLGNAYYKLNKYEDAQKQYSGLAENKSLSNESKAKVFHNLGNSFLKEKKYDESIEAYKNSLILNPGDNDTRYNLAYAKAMLQQQQQQNKNNKDQKNKDQQNKDQKNKDQQNKDQQNKDQKNKDQQNKDQQNKEQQNKDRQKDQGISKEDAEKILQALNNDEKKTQKKLSKKDAEKISIDKQW